jgi:monoterpene epsilon-lactone hydrolase
MIIMPSLHFRLIKTIIQLRRLLNPPTGVLDVEKERAETEALAANFKTKIELTCISVNANKVPAEWIITPKTSADRVILYLHGGSYNSGSIASHRSLAANIANAAKARALIIDYRLAPEYPFPAAVEDAKAAYRWLLENQLSPDHIIVAGDSCGGGLALSLLISLRDEEQPLPAAAVCLSPWTNLTCTGKSWETNLKKDIMLDSGALIKSAQLYLGGSDPRMPLASPLYADLKGLPPLLIQVGSEELFLSDATRFAEQAQAAAVKVTLQVWKGMQHEWHFAANILPEGRQAIEQIGQFIEAQLGSV